MPDRVVRQYGRVQGVPLPPIRPNPMTARRDEDLQVRNAYTTAYADGDRRWQQRFQSLFDLAPLPRTTAEAPGVVAAGYMEWYIPVSHRCILPTSQPFLPPVYVPEAAPQEEFDQEAVIQAHLADIRARFDRGEGLSREEMQLLLSRAR